MCGPGLGNGVDVGSVAVGVVGAALAGQVHDHVASARLVGLAVAGGVAESMEAAQAVPMHLPPAPIYQLLRGRGP